MVVPSPYLLAGAVLTVAVAVAVGVVAHELTHAAVLYGIGVGARVEWLPATTDRGPLRATATGTWATVRLVDVPTSVPPWGLRVAAIAPVALATPLVLIAAGLLANPIQSGDLLRALALAGWLACAIPSPGDFAVFWNAEAVLADRTDGAAASVTETDDLAS